MRQFIRQLRRKPAHIKERIALGTTLVGTLVLVFFWITVVRYEILPKQNLAKSKSPFETVGEIFKTAYKGTVASVGSIGNAEEDKKTGEGKLIVVPQKNIYGKGNNGNVESNNLEVNQ